MEEGREELRFQGMDEGEESYLVLPFIGAEGYRGSVEAWRSWRRRLRHAGEPVTEGGEKVGSGGGWGAGSCATTRGRRDGWGRRLTELRAR